MTILHQTQPYFGKLTLDQATIRKNGSAALLKTFERLSKKYEPVIRFLDQEGIDLYIGVQPPSTGHKTKEFEVTLEATHAPHDPKAAQGLPAKLMWLAKQIYYKLKQPDFVCYGSQNTEIYTTQKSFKPEYALLAFLLRATEVKQPRGHELSKRWANQEFDSLRAQTERKIQEIKPDYHDPLEEGYQLDSPAHNYT